MPNTAPVSVPAEPTPEMLDRAVAFALNVTISGDYNWSAYMRDVWRTMLAAAPVPPIPEGGGDALKRMDQFAYLLHRVANQFKDYGDQHMAKSPPDTVKAERNYGWFEVINAALANADWTPKPVTAEQVEEVLRLHFTEDGLAGPNIGSFALRSAARAISALWGERE